MKKQQLIKPLVALGVVGGLFLPFGFEWSQVRAEARAFDDGDFGAAAAAASKVHLLHRVLAKRVVRQLNGMAAFDIGQALPLLKLFAADDPALKQRLVQLTRVLDPTRLELRELRIGGPQPAGSPSPVPLERFRASDTREEGGPWGQSMALERLDNAGNWTSLGTGFSGPSGASFETTSDGRVLWLARAEQHRLERWDLVAGSHTELAVTGEPGLVAIVPDDPDRVAYSRGADDGDTLWLADHGKIRPLYQHPSPPLGLEFSEDGQSVLLNWETRGDGKPTTHVVWVRLDGTVGLTTQVPVAAADFVPTWVSAPSQDREGLVLGERSWCWAARADQATALPGAVGVWGFDPDGTAIAGLDGRKLYVQSLTRPARRFERELDELPANFEAYAASFRWARDAAGERLTFGGLIVEDQEERDSTITLRLVLDR